MRSLPLKTTASNNAKAARTSSSSANRFRSNLVTPGEQLKKNTSTLLWELARARKLVNARAAESGILGTGEKQFYVPLPRLDHHGCCGDATNDPLKPHCFSLVANNAQASWDMAYCCAPGVIRRTNRNDGRHWWGGE